MTIALQLLTTPSSPAASPVKVTAPTDRFALLLAGVAPAAASVARQADADAGKTLPPAPVDGGAALPAIPAATDPAIDDGSAGLALAAGIVAGKAPATEKSNLPLAKRAAGPSRPVPLPTDAPPATDPSVADEAADVAAADDSTDRPQRSSPQTPVSPPLPIVAAAAIVPVEAGSPMPAATSAGPSATPPVVAASSPPIGQAMPLPVVSSAPPPSAAAIPSPVPEAGPVDLASTGGQLPGREASDRSAAARTGARAAPIAIAAATASGQAAPLPAATASVGATAPAAQAFAAAILAADRQDRAVPDKAVTASPIDAASMAGLAATQTVAAPTGGEQPTLDLRHQGWPAAMVDHIERLRDEAADRADAGSTRIRVVPDALGSIDVSMRRHDDGTVQVALAADQPATRALIADARPELTRLGEQRGLRLDIGSGSAGSSGGGNAHGGGSADPGRRPAAPVAAAPLSDPSDPADGRVA